ncbi:unnamed protein product [Parnassius apollo]|uniref:(apollo) hypothetical protein n=1 Tax=Parnassius apollo TaxID=110799 RepID=A0A8S3XQZ7_PARAO|nr:unnamed protein product [Parnassius apollo]
MNAKYAHVKAIVDSAPPSYDEKRPFRNLPKWRRHAWQLATDNTRLLMAIKMTHFNRGKVDSYWREGPPVNNVYYENRAHFLKEVQRENKAIYTRILKTRPQVSPTSTLQRDWEHNRREILMKARNKFVLFPPEPKELIEDAIFLKPPQVKRPRVYFTLRFHGGATIGELKAELFEDICPETCRLFLNLLDGDEFGYGYVGTCFFRLKMLVSEATIAGGEILLKIISPEGQTFTASFTDETLIEEVKNRATDFFYPNGENGGSRYKLIRVFDTSTLHDFLTLAQEQIGMQEEILLIERRIPDAGTLWDLGTVRAPQQSAIAAATASLPPPQASVRQPNLQSLLSTNELTYELRKILISLIEAGARLAAAGRNYELTLAQLSAALDEPQRTQVHDTQVITPEEIAARLNTNQSDTNKEPTIETNGDIFKRAAHLQKFLQKFHAWKLKIAEPPNPEAITALSDLGFTSEQADEALRCTGCNVPAAASWLIGERGSSVFELVNGLPDGVILQTLLKQPQIQRGLLNTRMLIAFIAMVGQTGSAALWLHSPHGSPLLSQISRTYHSEKYCLAVNQFSEERTQQNSTPSTSRQRR